MPLILQAAALFVCLVALSAAERCGDCSSINSPCGRFGCNKEPINRGSYLQVVIDNKSDVAMRIMCDCYAAGELARQWEDIEPGTSATRRIFGPQAYGYVVYGLGDDEGGGYREVTTAFRMNPGGNFLGNIGNEFGTVNANFMRSDTYQQMGRTDCWINQGDPLPCHRVIDGILDRSVDVFYGTYKLPTSKPLRPVFEAKVTICNDDQC